ncbi:hypothetical protein BH10BAC3_BH10BAC3_36900 [soil metagenome]
MRFLKNVFFFFIGLCFSHASLAQNNTVKPKPKIDTTAPKLVIKFGPYGDSSKTLVSAMKQLLKTELKVTDTKGGTYNIISFDFAWRRKDFTDDFKTGIPKTIFIYNETTVRGDSHIPINWQKELQPNMQSQEELFFYNILAQNAKTKRLIKPAPLRLIIL